MNIEEFKLEIEKLGLSFDEDKRKKLDIIYNFLIETNKTMNLTRITDYEEVYLKHFYDSLTLTKIYDLSTVNTLCDVGSGAGFPGLVLKIFYPNLNIILIDALEKRVKYLNTLIEKLKLTNITAIHIRSEDLIKQGKTFDIVTARAVKALPTLLTWVMPLVNKKGSFLAMKGIVEEELKQSQKTLNKNNWEIRQVVKLILPKEESKRTLLEIKHKQNN